MMITLRMIRELGLPIQRNKVLDEKFYMVSTGVLTELEEKYNLSSKKCFKKDDGKVFNIEKNPFINEKDKNLWLVNYEVALRSSKKYRFYVWLCSHGIVKDYCY